MATQRVQLFYKLTQTEIIPPTAPDIERKEKWIQDMKATVKSEWEPKIIKVEYSIHDPEIDDVRRFFNGPVVKYWVIQNKEMTSGEPDTLALKEGREQVLDYILGYDVRLAKMIARKRASTADFNQVQQWTNFLNTIQEDMFDANGYVFPNSEEFWKLNGLYGYERAEQICVSMLHEAIKRKHETPQ